MNETGEIRPSEAERLAWEEEFAAAAKRPLALRLRYAFVRTYKPVLDDVPFRSFERMADYRDWCTTELPSWLGYGRI
jgi:hypothetical protein